MKIKNLTSVLNSEDLKKVKAGNFTDEDAIEIQERLKESKAETKTLS